MNEKKHLYDLTIDESYLDAFGHMNNATYLQLFEKARWEIITNNGYDQKKILDTGLGPTVLEIKITFLKEILANQKITIESIVLFYKHKIGKISQKMIRDGIVCCKAEFTVGLFSLTDRKLVVPTDDWLCALGVKAHPL